MNNCHMEPVFDEFHASAMEEALRVMRFKGGIKRIASIRRQVGEAEFARIIFEINKTKEFPNPIKVAGQQRFISVLSQNDAK